MGFEVMEGSPRAYWAPMDTTSTPTLHTGQLVQSTGDGVGPLAIASGAADTTNKQVIKGVVVGNNNDVQTFDSTYNANYITAVITQAAQAAHATFGVEGPTSKGDNQAMVKIAEITPETVLRGQIFASSTVHGTALSTLTVTTGSTDGLGFTSNACDFTPVADLCTSYCRSGGNGNIYRISDDISTTIETNDLAFPADIAINDTFVRAPIRTTGLSYVQFNSTAGIGLWLDGTASPATDYFIIDVLDLDLSNPGHENVIFRFAPCHFDPVRA